MSQTKYDRLRRLLVANNMPDYRFAQIVHAIFKERIADFDCMTALSKHLRASLAAEIGPSILTIKPLAQSRSQQAIKHLFELPDRQRIEAVEMKYRTGRESFCISSQAGCGLACTFCATGAIGLGRNLTADEITDQVLYFHLARDKIDSISFMGMGEPLANPETFTALNVLTARELFAHSPRRITVSTVGMIPGIQRITKEFPQVNLVFSLHSPFNEQRTQMIPLNRIYPLDRVMVTLDDHISRTNRQVSLAYLLLKGINDSPAHADGLISLLKGRRDCGYLYHVNLIRYNLAVGAPCHYATPDKTTVADFFRRLKEGGVSVTCRPSFGANIDAACGQLHNRY